MRSGPNRTWRARLRRSTNVLLAVGLLLIIARVALPYAIERYVNRTLDRLPNYDGRIEGVSVSLFRGAYIIRNVSIIKTTGAIPEPLFAAETVDLSVNWGALLEGKWVGEINIDHGALSFVNATSSARSQTTVDSEWLEVVKDLFPLRLNRFELADSAITYLDKDASRPVNVKLSSVFLTGTNFSNTRSPTEGLVATLSGTGVLEQEGRVKLDSALEPAARRPTFRARVALEALPVVTLNDLLKAYVGVDAEGGTLSVYSELNAKDGKITGYVKPLLRHLKILKPEKDLTLSFSAIWEVFVSALSEIFENQRHEQIATTVQLSGSLEEPGTSTFQALIGILRNAFIEAFRPGWEKRIGSNGVAEGENRGVTVVV